MQKTEFAVKMSTFSKTDRQNISQYLAQYSASAPNRFKQELERYIGIIGETPLIFSTYNADPRYRHVVIYGSYVMFYTVDETAKTVFVYRVLHGSQNIENIL